MTAVRPDFLDVLDAARSGAALEDTTRSVDYASLDFEVSAVAAALRARGVRLGDRVVVSLPNSVTSVVAFLACAALGAIWVGVNPAASVEERARQCEIVSPRLVIDADALATPSGDRAELPARADLDAPCAIAFSSGTTGPPKALVHSRATVSLAASALASTTLHRDDRVGVTLPCSIHNVMIVGPLTSLIAGATTVLLDGFSASAVAAQCRARRLTMVRALVPATVYDLVHDDGINADSLSMLREAGTGAAGLAESLKTAFEAKFGVRMSGSYGLSEAPAAVCSEDTSGPRRPGSSGVPLPHVSISIRDGDGMPLPTGESGQVWVGPATDGPWAGQYRGLLGHWVDGQLIPAAPGAGRFGTGETSTRPTFVGRRRRRSATSRFPMRSSLLRSCHET
jgi:malonyl-CoA/methylmalonyl-CoA synthetase